MDDIASLRNELEKYRQSHPRQRYPDELRVRILDFTRQQMVFGKRPWRVAQELGMGQSTMQRVLAAAKHEQSERLLPVRIVEPLVRRHIVVRGGCGVCIEGLELADVAELLRALSC